jgi:molecular chaperone Hsp33
MPTDRLIAGEVRGRGVAFAACEATGAAVEAEWRHLLGRTAAIAVSRALAGAALLAARLDPKDRLSLQWNVDGPLRGLIAEADGEGRVRGFPHVKVIQALDASSQKDYTYGLGRRGTLVATLARAGSRSTHRTRLDIEAGTIASELEAWLRHVDEREAAVELVVDYAGKVEYAAGLLVALDREADPAYFAGVRERVVEKEAFGAIAAFREPEAFVRRFFEGEAIDVRLRRDIRFACACSREKAFALVRALPPDEIAGILARDRQATAVCQFCSDAFEFGEADLRSAKEAAERGDPPPPLPPEFGGPLGPPERGGPASFGAPRP